MFAVSRVIQEGESTSLAGWIILRSFCSFSVHFVRMINDPQSCTVSLSIALDTCWIECQIHLCRLVFIAGSTDFEGAVCLSVPWIMALLPGIRKTVALLKTTKTNLCCVQRDKGPGAILNQLWTIALILTDFQKRAVGYSLRIDFALCGEWCWRLSDSWPGIWTMSFEYHWFLRFCAYNPLQVAPVFQASASWIRFQSQI